jgi:hypothetical protein
VSRNFQTNKGSDWLQMYQAYAFDSYCPDSFHTWVGILTLAGACERRIWIDHGRYQTYPNLYALLISRPGVGKSTAISAGTSGLLRFLRGKGIDERMGINFISQQSSEAGFYDPQFKRSKEFYVGNDKKTQSPGFIIFSEAANSMKEMPGGGNIMKALTEFYDCPPYWDKSLTKQETLKLTNICPTLLAACTFSDLPDIIPAKNLGGGLASRFVFIPEFERKIRTPTFKTGAVNDVLKQCLIEDLQHIFELSGEIIVDESFHEEWSYLHGESDKALNKAPNSHLECLLARRFLTIEKLSILCSLSSGSSMKITKFDWERATHLYDAQAKHLPRILEFSSVTDDQRSMTDAIMRYVADNPGCQEHQVKSYMLDKGLDPFRIDSNVKFMIQVRKLIVAPDGQMSCQVPVDDEDSLPVITDSSDVKAEALPTETAHH